VFDTDDNNLVPRAHWSSTDCSDYDQAFAWSQRGHFGLNGLMKTHGLYTLNCKNEIEFDVSVKKKTRGQEIVGVKKYKLDPFSPLFPGDDGTISYGVQSIWL